MLSATILYTLGSQLKMPFITFKKPCLWDEACYEVQTGMPEIPLQTGGVKFNPAIYSPVFAGYSYQYAQPCDSSCIKDFDASRAHPSTVGYSMAVLNKEETSKETVLPVKSVSHTQSSAVTYLTTFLFPTVSAALEAMILKAKSEKCFERKRTKFNACDFLTEYLYKNNPLVSEEERERRSSLNAFDIPFAKEWLLQHPRKPLPLSLVWNDDQAAAMLQAGWKGYLVRRTPEVTELRKWQREWREENRRVLDDEIERLFSRAQSQASSHSARSRPSSRKVSAQRRTNSGKRHAAQLAAMNDSNVQQQRLSTTTPSSLE